MKQKRLTSEKWLLAGFDCLSKNGPQSLKAEVLARVLGATKGSFYWHFKDIGAYHSELVVLWSTHAVVSFTHPLTQEDTVTLQLRRLAQPPDISSPVTAAGLEIAMRAWSHSNHTLANVITDIDSHRIAYLAGLLRQLDITDPSFSTLIYGAWVGLHMQNISDARPSMETLIDLILALR